jgi:hypothetical protein
MKMNQMRLQLPQTEQSKDPTSRESEPVFTWYPGRHQISIQEISNYCRCSGEQSIASSGWAAHCIRSDSQETAKHIAHS